MDASEAGAKDDKKASKFEAFQKKYQTGDLGEGMSADLNYTLKRLVRGLTSDNHGVKRGFFLASVSVIRSFKAQIDITKLIKLIKDETKTSKIMKNPEINALALGQLMCLSSLIDSEAYKIGNLVNSDILASLTSSLIFLYQTYNFLRESIQAALQKLIQKLPVETHGAKVLEKIVSELLVQASDGGKVKDYALQHSDNLSLYLVLKHLYQGSKLREQSPKLAKVLGHDVIADENDLHRLRAIAGRSVYIYPRLHTSLPLLINELYQRPQASSTKLRLQEIRRVC